VFGVSLLPPRIIGLVDGHDFGAGSIATGMSHAIAFAVGTGEMPETLRVDAASDVVAFGRRDVITPGYRHAVAAAVARGFEAVERLAGGRAAAFHTGTLAFSWAIPAVDPRAGVQDRFERVSELMATVFRKLGADARVGEVPGEYCPGSHSVNIGGTQKVMGVGQRLVRGAAHIGGVVVVNDAERIRDVLVPVYEALDLAWDPNTAGALDDTVPGVGVEDVRRAILEEVAESATLVTQVLPADVAEMGRRLSPTHRPSVSIG
jgi:octanoyl-[GcvH]:protein N-octanoyltransferase